MSVFSLAEFAAKLGAFDHNLKTAEAEIIAEGCAMVAGRAKDIIGVPQPGWAPLKPETIARKDGVNSPLLESGELRSSIEWNADAHEGYVGSNNPKAIWQELGTSRGIPPRPFIYARRSKWRAKSTRWPSVRSPLRLRERVCLARLYEVCARQRTRSGKLQRA
jgi:hypothetical protein